MVCFLNDYHGTNLLVPSDKSVILRKKNQIILGNTSSLLMSTVTEYHALVINLLVNGCGISRRTFSVGISVNYSKFWADGSDRFLYQFEFSRC